MPGGAVPEGGKPAARDECAVRVMAAGLAALLAGKPRLRRLEFSEEMLAPGLALRALGESFPGVSFRAVD